MKARVKWNLTKKKEKGIREVIYLDNDGNVYIFSKKIKREELV